MTRTFSKIYGLAGLRIGWVYAPARHHRRAQPHARAVQRQCGRPSRPASPRSRTARISSAPIAHNDRWLAWLTRRIEPLGLRVTPSVGNFVLVHFPANGGHRRAAADAYLSERGFILRRVAAYGFPNALRMTVGTEEANRGVVEALARRS